MRKTKEDKGITLVALIITIIVLLILAVVAISAVQNDGIMEYAKNARTEYEEAQADEQSTLEYYLSKIEENDSETIKRKEKENFELLEKYILGDEKAGINTSEVFDFGTHVFKNNANTIPNASTDVVYLTTRDEEWVLFIYKNGIYKFQSDYSEETQTNTTKNLELLYTLEYAKDEKGENIGKSYVANNKEGAFKEIYYIKYNNKAYSVLINTDTLKVESVEVVYEPKGREGDLVKYDSDGKNGPEDWIILTDRDGLVEIVSPDAMGSLTLGSEDTNEKAILSYENAITTINNYCKEIVETETDKSKIRSVGGTNNEGTPYYTMSTNFSSWFNGDKESVPSGDMQYELDYVKLAYFGKASTTKNYWIASRCVNEYPGSVTFGVRGVSTGDYVHYGNLWWVSSEGRVGWRNSSIAVRPVVINPSGI